MNATATVNSVAHIFVNDLMLVWLENYNPYIPINVSIYDTYSNFALVWSQSIRLFCNHSNYYSDHHISTYSLVCICIGLYLPIYNFQWHRCPKLISLFRKQGSMSLYLRLYTKHQENVFVLHITPCWQV